MGISIAVPAYQRRGIEALPEYRGTLQKWGEVQLGILEDDAELVSIKVEDEADGSSENKIKAEDLREALDIICAYLKRLEKIDKTGPQKLK